MIGVNKYTGAIWEIEFKDAKNFSRQGLNETVMFPNKENSLEETQKLIRKNKGAEGFFSYTAKEFKLAADDVEKELDTLSNRLLGRHRRR